MTGSIAYPKMSRETLEKSIELLTTIERTDVPFLSCYLDIEAGNTSCMDFLQAESTSIRAGLGEADLIDFDSAYESILAAASEHWSSEVRGLAIFARSIMGGKFFSVIPTALPFKGQLTYYPVPDVRPLLSLRDAYETHFLLWAAPGGIEISRVDCGQAHTLAWVAQRAIDQPNDETIQEMVVSSRRRSVKRPLGNLARQTLSRVLRSAGGMRLVLAGEDNHLASLWAWLPRHLQAAVSQSVSLPWYADRTKALRQIVDHTAANCRSAVDSFVTTCLQSKSASYRCVTGPDKTRSAMGANMLDTLLISSLGVPALTAVTPSSAVRRSAFASERVSNIVRGQLWDAGIELSRMACQHGVRTLVTNARELLQQGEVGGLMRDAAAVAVMPRPHYPAVTRLVA